MTSQPASWLIRPSFRDLVYQLAKVRGDEYDETQGEIWRSPNQYRSATTNLRSISLYQNKASQELSFDVWESQILDQTRSLPIFSYSSVLPGRFWAPSYLSQGRFVCIYRALLKMTHSFPSWHQKAQQVFLVRYEVKQRQGLESQGKTTWPLLRNCHLEELWFRCCTSMRSWQH